MNESQLQQSLVEWCRLHPRMEAREILRNYLVAVANGGKRPAKLIQTKHGLKRISLVGQQLKKQGCYFQFLMSIYNLVELGCAAATSAVSISDFSN